MPKPPTDVQIYDGGACLPVISVNITKDRQARIHEVVKLKARGFKQREIAETLGISRQQVERDLGDAKLIAAAVIESYDVDSFLWKSIMVLEQIRNRSMRDAELAANEANRIGHRRTAMDAQEKLVKLLQECGLLVKVPDKLDVNTGAIPQEAFCDPAVRDLYMEIMIRVRQVMNQGG